jgi:hypothetical protein
MKQEKKIEIEKQTKDPEEIKEFLKVLKSMAERILLPNNILKNVDINKDGKVDGYQFDIANPFYTAESIASVNDVKIKVDQEDIPSEKIKLIVRGQQIKMEDAKTMNEVWWGFGEVISVFIEKNGGIIKGKYELDVILRMRTTITYGFPSGLLFPSKKSMVLN